MQVVIEHISDPSRVFDVTDRLIEDVGLGVSMAREERSFERVADDVDVAIDNSDGFVTSTIFPSITDTQDFNLRVRGVGRTLFLGRLNGEVRVGAMSEQVRLLAFSLLKLFWERAKSQDIYGNPLTPSERDAYYLTPKQVLEHEFILAAPRSYNDLFTGVRVAPAYESRNIRGFASASAFANPQYNDFARYSELAGTNFVGEGYAIKQSDGQTTKAAMLTAMATYYNAEFVIDHDNRELVMVPRNMPTVGVQQNATTLAIDAVLRDDKEPELRIPEEERFDYIRTFIVTPNVSTPPTIANVVTPSGVFPYGFKEVLTYYYTLTIATTSGTLYETAPSQAFTVDVPALLTQYGLASAWLTLEVQIPTGYSGAHVYRNKVNGWTGLNEAGSGRIYTLGYNGGASVQFTDKPMNSADDTRPVPPYSTSVVVYQRYDRTTGTWRPPQYFEYDLGATFNLQHVFDAVPKLQWHGRGETTLREQNGTDIATFFGSENLDPSFADAYRSQFLEVFKPKKYIDMNVATTDIAVGDGATWTKPPATIQPASNMVVKSVRVDLIEEFSEISLLTT